MSARYPVPAERHQVEQVIDRSRFRCTVARVQSTEEAQAFVKEMQAAYVDATHNCWAYVVGPPGSTDRIGMSDDGEPHGTAGRPMLTVLSHSGIGEIGVVVTRWYGGTKLGTGGLVKAYGGAVQAALATLVTVERVDTVDVAFEVSYPQVGALLQGLPTVQAEVLEQRFAVEAHFVVRLPREQVPALARLVRGLTRGVGTLREVDG